MKFLHINRRTHLYLSLFLLPWFLLYGVSSIMFSHGTYFEELDQAKGIPQWTKIDERSNYEIPVPGDGDDLMPLADRVVKDLGLNGSHGAFRQGPNRIDVFNFTFWRSTQAKYFIDEKRLLVEDRRFRWDHFLTGMHGSGGYEDGGLRNFWAVLVDVVCVGMLLWILTGLIMWWKLPQTRNWGWLAVISGMMSFAWFLWKL